MTAPIIKFLVSSGLLTKLLDKVIDKKFKEKEVIEETQDLALETVITEKPSNRQDIDNSKVTNVSKQLRFNDGRGGMLYKLGDHPNHPYNGMPVVLLSGDYGRADYVALKGSAGELAGEFSGMANPESDGVTLRAHYRWKYSLQEIRDIIGKKPYSIIVKTGNDIQELRLPHGLKLRQD
jgi:hypothetical protein